MTEKRFCEKCMQKTIQQIIEKEDTIYTYKRKRLYKCQQCGNAVFKRGLRPSSESVY